jgi:hypothetical protein
MRVGEGIQFTLAVRMRSDSDETPNLTFSRFDVQHEGDIPFVMSVSVDGRTRLGGLAQSEQSNGGGLCVTGGSGSFGPMRVGRWDTQWWLKPLPDGEIEFNVGCPVLALQETSASFDATGLADLSSAAVGFLGAS